MLVLCIANIIILPSYAVLFYQCFKANLLHMMIAGSLAFTSLILLVARQQDKPTNVTPAIFKGSLETFAIPSTKQVTLENVINKFVCNDAGRSNDRSQCAAVVEEAVQRLDW